MTDGGFPSREELKSADCWRPSVDRVPGEPSVTAFKQGARLHQARWRAQHGYPPGTQPYQPTGLGTDKTSGSRIDHDFAVRNKVNLSSRSARDAADARLANPQPHQMLNSDRLWCDLLSSMPLCFNVFGPLAAEADLARSATLAWFPDAPGEVSAVHLEWSPGRLDPLYLNNRSAFDAAIELDLGNGEFGLIGIETKYHEHARSERPPKPDRVARYMAVARDSGIFDLKRLHEIPGSRYQQIWQDHLLVLAMLQHPSHRWKWARFVIVHPAGNPSFADAADAYRELLTDTASFQSVTLESLIDQPGALPAETSDALRERYLW